MPVFLVIALITFLHFGVHFTPRRYRLSLTALAIIALGGTFIWSGWENGPYTPPGYAGIVIVVFGLALGLFAFAGKIRHPTK